MIYSIKNSDGYIYAYVECELIDSQHLLIKHAWVHDSYRRNGALPSIVLNQMIMNREYDDVQFVGWERGSEGKKFRWYPMYRILRRMNNGKH